VIDWLKIENVFFIRRLHTLDNDVRASGFSKELERQFEEVRLRYRDF
jgi:hypothetical protein